MLWTWQVLCNFCKGADTKLLSHDTWVFSSPNHSVKTSCQSLWNSTLSSIFTQLALTAEGQKQEAKKIYFCFLSHVRINKVKMEVLQSHGCCWGNRVALTQFCHTFAVSLCLSHPEWANAHKNQLSVIYCCTNCRFFSGVTNREIHVYALKQIPSCEDCRKQRESCEPEYFSS